MANTSLGCSIATIALAANNSFSQVRRKLIICTPSPFRLYTYCSIWKSTLVLPTWVHAANIFVTSSSLRVSTSKPPDIAYVYVSYEYACRRQREIYKEKLFHGQVGNTNVTSTYMTIRCIG
uniref:Uncharacterized protein n=1 Tax=Photinus pyralis TaxID=7054 RepID=A0A1Y1L1L8_PHOPY